MVAPARRYSIHDLAGFPDDGKLRELVDGRMVEWDVPTYEQGEVEAILAAVLLRHAQEHRLGHVVSGEVMVRVQGSEDAVRGADIAFYRRGRPRDRRAAATLAVPDLVVEILSPSDRAGEVDRKIGHWLRAGVRLLWYVNPETGTTTVHTGAGSRCVAAEETLDGGDVLPGLRLRLRDLLEQLERDDD